MGSRESVVQYVSRCLWPNLSCQQHSLADDTSQHSRVAAMSHQGHTPCLQMILCYPSSIRSTHHYSMVMRPAQPFALRQMPLVCIFDQLRALLDNLCWLNGTASCEIELAATLCCVERAQRILLSSPSPDRSIAIGPVALVLFGRVHDLNENVTFSSAIASSTEHTFISYQPVSFDSPRRLNGMSTVNILRLKGAVNHSLVRYPLCCACEGWLLPLCQ